LYFAALGVGLLIVLAWIMERPEIVAWLASSNLAVSVGSNFVWFLGLLVLMLIWWALAQQRHLVAGVAYGYTLARLLGTLVGSRAKLEDMNSEGIRHVLCATELHAGRHAYFTHDLVYSRGFGLGEPGGLPIGTAVQLSANFPGGFPPRILRAERFGFDLADRQELRWNSTFADLRRPIAAAPRWMVLSDGGVFDNTADAWYLDEDDLYDRLAHEMDRTKLQELNSWREKTKEKLRLDNVGIYRQFDLPQYHPEFLEPFNARHYKILERLAAIAREAGQSAEAEFERTHGTGSPPSRANPRMCLIVVNAGKAEPWQSLWSVWIPFIGELTGFGKITSTMYNNLVGSRLRDLRARFAQRAPEGAVVDIEESPYVHEIDAASRPFEGVPIEQFKRSRETEYYFRGDLEGGQTTAELKLIEGLANRSTAVATTLTPLGAEVTGHLMYHGYLQTMVKLHAQLGYPLLQPRPTVNSFLELAHGRPRTRRPVATRPQA
jgi:hypothetical protein